MDQSNAWVSYEIGADGYAVEYHWFCADHVAGRPNAKHDPDAMEDTVCEQCFMVLVGPRAGEPAF